MLSVPQLRGEEHFPSVSQALTYPNGLLAIGGDLSSSRLQHAYQQGIFPWFSENEPILWWSPDPRAVLYPQDFIEHRSFKKFLKQCSWTITLNTNFKAVIRACSENRAEGTWITPAIQMAYYNLHKEGVAHSVEVWQQDQLIGGLYGIAQGALFCGESMFSYQTNASKIALWAFCKHFTFYGGQLIDCQILNSHTQQLGAIEIPRQTYIDKLKYLQIIHLNQQCWKQGFLNIL